MLTTGCDVGSLTAEAVVLRDREILAFEIMKVLPRSDESARQVTALALEKAGLSFQDVEYCVGTGYGRKRIPFVDEVMSEIACHARGAQWLVPTVRTVIDIGGQDAKVIQIDGNGAIKRYEYNDRCAAGTGRFLEIMAEAMHLGIDEFGALSLQAEEPLHLSNQCTVFVETEIISLLNDGRELPDIIGGLHRSLAHRVAALAKSVGVVKDVAMTGGVAKNRGIIKTLGDELSVELVSLDQEPQIMGALGAALIAAEKLKSNS